MAQNLKAAQRERETSSAPGTAREVRAGLPGTRARRAMYFRLLDVFAVLIISLFMCLYRTGEGSFGGGDQTTHSLVVQHMVYHGDYLHPVYKGNPYFNKPPFKMWLATIPVLIFGESNYSYRVIDGLSGVGISLCVFLFARSLFASRLVSYLSLFALLGARLLFFGHGVRNAVQDSMMLLLMSLGAICGWYFIERVNEGAEENRSKLLRLAIMGGVFIGLAALTKNVAGYFSFIILGSFLLLSGELPQVVRRSWKLLLLILGISLAFPAAYIYVQPGKMFTAAWQMLLVHEIFKRATQGYHFVNHHWYYWDEIVRSRAVVPPELLAGALAFSIYQWFKRRDRRWLFLFCWALIPVLVQNAMKSKLLWYILPALPGMAIAVGAFLGASWEYLRARFDGFRLQPTACAAALVFFYGLGSLGYNFRSIERDIVRDWKRNVTDEMMEDIRAYSKSHPVRALIYNTPILANNEIFYWNMVPQETIQDQDPAALKARLDSGEVNFVVTPLDEFQNVARLKHFESFSLVPARDKRRFWLAVINYVPGFLPKHFTPAERKLVLADNPDIVNYGFKGPVRIGSYTVFPSSGPRSSFLLPSSSSYFAFGTNLTLNIASVLPTSQGKIDVHVYLNEQKLTTLTDVEEGFHERTFHIPPGKWRHRMNLLSLVYELPDGSRVGEERQIALVESLKIALTQ